MKEQTKQQLGDWYKYYPDVFGKLDNLALELGREYSKYTVFPEPNKIFKAFELCKCNSDLKVVIVGQDPYNNTFKYNNKELPYAQGYAFGNPHEAKVLSPSLQHIKNAVIESGWLFLNQDLENWQSQGILLLNTALTVRKNAANSHKELWSEFTINLIRELGKTQGLIWVLWGKEAQSYQKYINTEVSHIITAEHPAAASYANREWNYEDSFNRVNKIIEDLYGKEYKIIW